MVAEKVAITETYKYITMDDIASEIRDGKKGVDGIGSNGKMIKKFTVNWQTVHYLLDCNIFVTQLLCKCNIVFFVSYNPWC